MPNRLTLCAAAFASALIQTEPGAAPATSIVIDDFRTVDAWTVNPDGGFIEISRDAGRQSMRLKFVAGKFGWGNAAREVSLPRSTNALEFDVFVHNAQHGAYLAVWLFEPDGDGYLAMVNVGGKSLHELVGFQRHVRVPIDSFGYQPRGNKTPEPLMINKMLIGLGAADAEISVANLVLTTVEERAEAELARTKNLTVKDGPRGRVAVLQDRFPARPANANPEVLAKKLSQAGYGVTILKAGDLADPNILTSQNFDCLILPYGPSYPAAASDSIKAYLKSGGCFVSMGGYVFDEPCVPDAGGKLVNVDATFTIEDLGKARPEKRHLNTRFGRSGDTLGLDPEQIGTFDPGYILTEVNRIVGAGSGVLPVGFSQPLKCRGYAACAMLGSNNPVFPEKWGRLVPVLEGLDKLNRPVGPVGSIAFNYAGPYAGSAWAFFGITNVDLFANKGAMLEHLPQLVDAVTRRVFLHSLASEFACYTKDETAKITCKAANLGKKEVAVKVSFTAGQDDSSTRAECVPDSVSVRLKAGETALLETELRVRNVKSDLVKVTAQLTCDGQIIDRMETGFVVRDAKLVPSGPAFSYNNNYFRIGDRPVLFSGTNVTGAIFHSQNENPLVWDRDLARMSDSGLNILRVLHFSPFLSEKPGVSSVKPIDLDIDRLPPKIERQLDALVHLCRKHNVVLFLSLHDWMGVALSDEELAAQRKFARLIASRYRDVPGFMIDIQNEPHLELPREAGKHPPHVNQLWNDYLRAKYNTDEALKQAWKTSPPEAELGKIDYHAGTDAWDDMRTFDADYFRNVLVNRWIDANVSGIKEGNPNTPATVGFLQEYWALNKLLCSDRLDFANMHSYNSIDVLRADIKLFDRRFVGKSISLGEFGSVVDHDKRIRGEDNPVQDYMRFLHTGHYVFGLGGSFIANWCWKDMDDVVFPWGVNYPCGGPRKDILKAYRNQSLLLRQVRPAYKPQLVYLVVPVQSMLGAKGDAVVRALYRQVDALLDARVDFGVVDDLHLADLPSAAKLLIYPVPMNVPDDAYDRIKSFVERGGIVCISGDVSYDVLRRRTRTDRLTELCGVRFVSENYRNVEWGSKDKPCINVEAVGAVKHERYFLYKLGRGAVYYAPYPLSFTSGFITELLGTHLAELGADAVLAASDGHACRIPEIDGARTIILVNPSDKPSLVRISEPGCEEVSLSLAGNGVGMARFDKTGNLVAVESQGDFTVGSKTIRGKGHFALIACDKKPLTVSRELILLPFGGAELELTGLSQGLSVEVGDVVEGNWVKLTGQTARRLRTNPETAFDIHLRAPKNEMQSLRRRVVSALLLR